MTQQSGRYGYSPATEQKKYGGVADQVAEGTQAAAQKAREYGEEAMDRADEWLKPVGLSIRERPMTCLAVVGGLAFAAGAVWMLRNSRQQSRTDEILSQMSDAMRRARWW
jgi:hypothetical protein